MNRVFTPVVQVDSGSPVMDVLPAGEASAAQAGPSTKGVSVPDIPDFARQPGAPPDTQP